MRLFCGFACLLTAGWFTVATVDAAPPQIKIVTVVDNLWNPCGVAVQDGTGHIFVSESGAGRVVRIVDGKAEPVITGFPKDVYGKEPKYEIGPLGLAFLNRDTLIVGGGGLADGSELLRLYKVPPRGKSISADEMVYQRGPWTPELKLAGKAALATGEGNFYGVAATKNAIYFTANGDDTKGWIGRALVDGTEPRKIEPFVATKSATGVDAPVAITTSSRGEIVVGQMGEIDVPGDSLLTFYHPKTRSLLLKLATGLHDISGLAFGPTKNYPQGLLYAIDFSWHDPANGGLFRLDSAIKEGRQAIHAVEITRLDKPTAIAFAPNGALYITVFGTPVEGSEKKTGKLLIITGRL